MATRLPRMLDTHLTDAEIAAIRADGENRMRRYRRSMQAEQAHSWGRHDFLPGYYYEVCEHCRVCVFLNLESWFRGWALSLGTIDRDAYVRRLFAR